MSLIFEDHETRPSLVFLHGFCDTHELWDDFVKPFVPHFRVFTPDLPGFGKSVSLGDSFTIDQVADFISVWLTENNIVNAIIIGHSLGGYVALALAERFPGMVKGLCLFHSTPFADTLERKQIRNKVIEFVNKNGVGPFIKTFVPDLFVDKDHPAIKAVHARAIHTSASSLMGYSRAMRDRPDRSGQSKVPILILAGANDLLVPAEMLREWARMKEKCSYCELQNVAHMGIFESKTECQSIISRFASELST